jgi:signal transduction histidine kinase
MGTLIVLTIKDFQAAQDPADFAIGIPLLLLGCIIVGRTVLTLRSRDRLDRKANHERDRLFAQLEIARSSLEQVHELSGVAGWDAELPSRSCTLSPAAMKLLGLHAEPKALESFLGHFTPESGSAFQIALQDARKSGGTVDVDAQMKTNSETPRWIRLIGIAVNDEKGTCRFVGAMQDMSERVAQLELTRQDEVANALSRLSSRTAAEFKKDLIEISRSLAELGKRTSNGSLEHMLQQGMRLSVNRALDTAQSLQAFAANNPIEPGIININKSVSDIVSATKNLLPSSVSLAVHTDRAELLAHVDEAELELSLLHLLLNARDSMEAGGALTITTGTDENSWPYIDVRDTGLGMRPDVQSKIFEPFFSTKRAVGARGLGLSIVRGFVKQARGRLDLKSSPGTGSCFRLTFPPVGKRETPAEVTVPDFKPVRGTILLAHEDDSVLKALGPAMLEEGLILHYAPSAKDGLTMLEGRVRYDGILMSDLQARSLAGQALCARLPRQWPHAKFAVLSDVPTEIGISLGIPHLVLAASAPAAALSSQLARLIRDEGLNSTLPA